MGIPMQAFSDPDREDDDHALPDLEIFQLTARECAERDEDMVHQYMKLHEFRLAAMNSSVREAMFERMIDAECITGGWFYWYCLPGCMPDSDAIGPFETAAAARKAAQDDAAEGRE